MHKILKLSVSTFALLALPTMAEAKGFSQLVAFSGALSDTGNFTSVRGEYAAPLSRTKTTNGMVAVEVLAERLGLKAEPSMHLIGRMGGTNFAVADALAGGHGAHDLPAQIKAHLDRQGGKADPDALYFLFIGGNDVIMAAMTPDPKKAEKMLDDAVQGIEAAMKTLAAAGAKTIMAPDFIDVGMAPAVRTMGPQAQAWATKISDDYNRKFNALLARMERDRSFELIRWAFSDFVKSVAAHGEEVGFTNMTDACVAVQAAGRCDPATFVYLTEQYPTAKVHELMGSAMMMALLQREAAPAPQSAMIGH